MYRTILLTFLIMTLVTDSIAQSHQVQEVAQRVELLRQALVSPSRDALDKLVAEELSYGHSSGKVEDKNTFIESLVSGASDFVSIELSEQEVDVVTNDLALVRHKLYATTNDKGKGPGEVRLGILLVWLKREGSWMLVARQAYKI